jgi:hypothetical protein
VLKGQLYYSLNETQKSVTLIDQAIALNPDSEAARRAQNAKYEVARLLAKRVPRPAPDSQFRTASLRTVNMAIPRRARSRFARPMVLAMRTAFLSQENLTVGAGTSAAQTIPQGIKAP